MTDAAVELVELYIKLRTTKEKLTEMLKQKLEPIAWEMEETEKRLKHILDETDADSIKTKAGTFFKKTATSVTVRDMDAVLNFVKEFNAYDLFERKVNKTVVMSYIEDGTHVPGVEVNTEIKLQVRK